MESSGIKWFFLGSLTGFLVSSFWLQRPASRDFSSSAGSTVLGDRMGQVRKRVKTMLPSSGRKIKLMRRFNW